MTEIHIIDDAELKKAIYDLSLDSLEAANKLLIEDLKLLTTTAQSHSCLISGLCSFFQTMYGKEALLHLIKGQLDLVISTDV